MRRTLVSPSQIPKKMRKNLLLRSYSKERKSYNNRKRTRNSSSPLRRRKNNCRRRKRRVENEQQLHFFNTISSLSMSHLLASRFPLVWLEFSLLLTLLRFLQAFNTTLYLLLNFRGLGITFHQLKIMLQQLHSLLLLQLSLPLSECVHQLGLFFIPLLGELVAECFLFITITLNASKILYNCFNSSAVGTKGCRAVSQS